ncbi:hypothetical protein ACXYMX_16180 [Sporosarcina sp. CAU 1771]
MKFVEKEARANAYFDNKQYVDALRIYSELLSNENSFKEESIRLRYAWCLYRVYLNSSNSYDEEKLSNTKLALNFILSHYSNKDPIYQLTIVQILKAFSLKTHFEAEKINVWLNRLDPSLLPGRKESNSVDTGKFIYPSKKDKWYDLKFQVYESLEQYEKCLELYEEAQDETNGVDQETIETFKRKIDAIEKEQRQQVEHLVFGVGEIIRKDNKSVEVLFENGETITFSMDVYLKEQVLRNLSKEDTINELSLEELKLLSDQKAAQKEYDKETIRLNSKIIAIDHTKEITYYQRLLQSYFATNQIEEALEINDQILTINKSNKVARDFREIYGKGLHYKYNDKVFHGNYRDIGSPSAEVFLDMSEKEEYWKKMKRDIGVE